MSPERFVKGESERSSSTIISTYLRSGICRVSVGIRPFISIYPNARRNGPQNRWIRRSLGILDSFSISELARFQTMIPLRGRQYLRDAHACQAGALAQIGYNGV